MNVSFKSIGSNIRAARLKARLTQEQTAELLDMSVLHYGRMERGERPISLDQLVRISRTLDTSVFALFANAFPGEDIDVMLDQPTADLFQHCSKESAERIVDILHLLIQHTSEIEQQQP